MGSDARGCGWLASALLLGCAEAAPAPIVPVTMIDVPAARGPTTSRLGERDASSVRDLSNQWRRFVAALGAGDDTPAGFIHPEWGVFAVWQHEGYPVIARFDGLDELSSGVGIPPVDTLRALPLPTRLLHGRATCDAHSEDESDVALWWAAPGVLEHTYDGMRTRGLVMDDASSDQDLARNADHAISHGISVPAQQLEFLFGQLHARWFLLALRITDACPGSEQ
jgi:hypothetical protein